MNQPHTSSSNRRPAPAGRSSCSRPHGPATRSRSPHAGFTLVELVVAVAILAVLVGTAVNFGGAFGRSMKLTTLSNTFLAQLHLARSEAIKRNARVAICKSADGQACTRAGGWEQGWIVFHDADNDGDRDTAEAVVHRFQALPPGFRVAGNLNVARYVSFGANGGTRLASGAFQAGTLTVCRESLEATEARQIVINAVGRPRIQRVTVPSCV